MVVEVSGRTAVPGEHAPGAVRGGTVGRNRRSPAPGAGSSFLRPARRALSRAYWTTPRLLRALTALCLVGLLTLAAVAGTVLSGARDGIDSIGHHAAPQAMRTADLYFALNDMDAQAANMLQIGADPDYAGLRGQTLATYDQRRTQADGDLQQAAEAMAGDRSGQDALQKVMDGLGQYEALIARTLLLEDQAKAPAGKPSEAALESYRQATDLLRHDLLPAIDQVTTAGAGTVDRVYDARSAELSSGWWWLFAVGVLALAALGVLQWQLSARFRRTLNPALVAVTLVTVVFLAIGLRLEAAVGDHLRVAKRDAYDSVIELSKARAVAYDMNADESRYLADPARALAYEQSYLVKAQAIVALPGAELSEYKNQLDRAVATHRADRGRVPFDGYLGKELRNITFAGEQDAAERVLSSFQAYQVDDGKLRELRNEGRLKDAVTFNTGLSAGQSNYDFDQLSDALGKVLEINSNAMSAEVAAADRDLSTTALALGTAALVVALALTVLGVRPRLGEYR